MTRFINCDEVLPAGLRENERRLLVSKVDTAGRCDI